MIIACVILSSVTAFLLGLIVGMNITTPKKPTLQVVTTSDVVESLNKEYQNFLNYDGSVQN